jgi:hypothetical protein
MTEDLLSVNIVLSFIEMVIKSNAGNKDTIRINILI